MPGEVSSLLEQQVFEILKQTFGPENALLLMEYWSRRIPLDVARRRDIEGLRLEIEKVRAEIEKVRAELIAYVEQVRAESTAQIEQLRADLTKEIERVRADLTAQIEQVRVEGKVERERIRADLLKLSFVFWATQMLAIGGILFSLVQLMRSLP